MKCPKCGYLGFEDIERCRNCGYEFSLIHTPKSAKLPELTLRTDDETGGRQPEDLTLLDTNVRADAPPAWQFAPDIERTVTKAPMSAPEPSSELPLFQPAADDVPLITKVSPPRPPLSVRRATPEPPRVRAEPRRTPLFDLPSGAGEGIATVDSLAARLRNEETPSRAAEPQAASLGARLAAAFLDLTILTSVDAAVIYFTLQICGLTPGELAVLPKAPLLAFLLVQNGGYLVAFTLGGQTLGKIAAGIRVVSAEPDEPLDLGRAVMRTLAWALLALPAGLGFLTTLFTPDHRGLHDRFAGTRVVRAAS